MSEKNDRAAVRLPITHADAVTLRLREVGGRNWEAPADHETTPLIACDSPTFCEIPEEFL